MRPEMTTEGLRKQEFTPHTRYRRPGRPESAGMRRSIRQDLRVSPILREPPDGNRARL